MTPEPKAPAAASSRGAPLVPPLLLVALLLALVVRVVYWSEARDSSLFLQPSGDAATNLLRAETFRSEGPLAPEGAVYDQAPLYPAFLATLLSLGLDREAVRWVQFLLGMLGPVLLWLGTRRRAGPRAAGIAAILGALYGPFLFFEGEFLSISLAVFLLEVAYAFWPRRWAALALGLAALAQPNLLLAVLLVLAWGMWRPRDLELPDRRGVALVLVLALVPVLLTTTRNLIVAGEPVAISANGGVNFFIGNHAGSNGTFTIPPGSGLLNRPEGLFTSAREVAETARGGDLGARAVDRYWWGQGFDFWVTRTGDAVVLFGRKVLLALNGYEVPNHFDYGYIRSRVAPVLWGLPGFPVLLALAVAGFVFVGGRARRTGIVIVAALLVAVALFFITARYRLPLALALLPWAAVGVDGLIARRRSPAGWLPAAGAALLGLVLALLPLVSGASASAVHMLNLEGASLFSRGDVPGAEAKFREAVAANPTHAEARNNLGRVLAVQGRSAEAAEEYRIALGADPTQAETYFNLEELYREAGRLAEAEEILDRLETARGGRVDDVAPALDYRRGRLALARGDSTRAEALLRRAVAARGDLSGAWAILTDLEIGRHDTAAAVEAGRRATESGPGNREAHLMLGRALLAAGQPAEAVPVLERAWRLGPSRPEAPFYLGRAYLMQGDVAQAEGHLRASIDRGEYVPALLELGSIYERLNRPRDAAAVYQAVIRKEKQGPAREEALRRYQALQRRSRDGDG